MKFFIVNFFCIYLIASPNIQLFPVHVYTIGNIRGLLFDSDQEIQCTPVESYLVKFVHF